MTTQVRSASQECLGRIDSPWGRRAWRSTADDGGWGRAIGLLGARRGAWLPRQPRRPPTEYTRRGPEPLAGAARSGGGAAEQGVDLLGRRARIGAEVDAAGEGGPVPFPEKAWPP